MRSRQERSTWLEAGVVACAFLLVLFSITAALADTGKPLKGVALVVGQSNYAALPKLGNPVNDARAIDRLLTGLGFDVVTVTDGDRRKLTRDLQRFVEDAADADVALLYYSGHGIEAGGEDFLVPTDADLSALDSPESALVPLSPLLDRLKANVPVSLVLLDACRTDPFPPGATARIGGTAAAVASVGLAAPKGAMPLSGTAATQAAANTSLATVIGFAAEPGHAALDGQPGGNSPYATALLKHLAAKGFDFGDVMTMVTEEVYLETRAAQRPWTNTSLRRLLYFGVAPPEDADKDQAAIRGARRKLLLTIAATPADMRSMVETIAKSDAVPLDQLYGMLNVLQVDTSGGRQAIAEQLQQGAQKLKSILDQRDAVLKQDPEIVRLSGLADQAEQQGAIKLALDFRSRASDRADQIAAAVDEAEAGVKARRVELAQTYQRHAETAILNFDFQTAAEKYEAASRQAARFDPQKAFEYRLAEADALTDHGTYKGDKAALENAVATYNQALAGAPRSVSRVGIAMVESNLANALVILGEREQGTEHFEQAAEVYASVLKTLTRRRYPQYWAGAVLNLANVYQNLGERNGDVRQMKKAAEAFRSAIDGLPRDAAPLDWAGAENNLGNALSLLGERTADASALRQSIEAFQASLEVRTREAHPVDWAQSQGNLGVSYHALGSLTRDKDLFEKAASAFRAEMEVETRDKMPIQWAGAENNLATALEDLGNLEDGTARLEEAAAALRAAMQEVTRERDPVNWAAAEYNLGRILTTIGGREHAPARYEEAIAALQSAVDELEKGQATLLLARARGRLGEALLALGKMRRDLAMIGEAKTAFEAAWGFWKAQNETRYDPYFTSEIAASDQALKAP